MVFILLILITLLSRPVSLNRYCFIFVQDRFSLYSYRLFAHVFHSLSKNGAYMRIRKRIENGFALAPKLYKLRLFQLVLSPNTLYNSARSYKSSSSGIDALTFSIISSCACMNSQFGIVSPINPGPLFITLSTACLFSQTVEHLFNCYYTQLPLPCQQFFENN